MTPALLEKPEVSQQFRESKKISTMESEINSTLSEKLGHSVRMGANN